MEPIRYCLLKGKDSCLDHRKSIREHGCCWWTQSHGLRVGDICYLYIADHYSKSIRYKLEVVDADCKREDQDCWRRGFKDKGTCAKLVPIAEYYGGDELTMDRLEELGISKFTISSFLDEKHVEAIDKFFKKS